MNSLVVKVEALKRVYKTLAGDLEVLKSVDLEIKTGEIVGLIGPSGSGKSSLLHAVGLLEAWQEGNISIDSELINNMDDSQRTKIRLEKIGFVYQFHNLLPEFNARDNIAIPMLIKGASFKAAEDRANELLDLLGLTERGNHMPPQLSGGEQQRVAIARALANKPRLLIADEPTGNLDPTTSGIVFELFQNIVNKENLGALVATHNYELAGKMTRILKLDAGKLISN